MPLEAEDIKDDFSTQPKRSYRKMLISILYKVQKYSAYTFLGFLGLHASTVIILPGLQIPLDICQESFEIARLVYLSYPFEQVVVSAALICHVMAGVSIRLVRKMANNNKAINKHPKFHKPRHLNEDMVDPAQEDVDYNLSTSLSHQNADTLVSNPYDESHGLGGITSLIGLGSRKSIISNLTGLTPLSFSGYCLIPLVLYHISKFKWVPTFVDDDNLLVNLQYINVILNQSMIKWGNALNFLLLLGLIWTASYHFTSGMLKFKKKFLNYYKKLGYGIISGVSIIGIVSMLRLKYVKFDNGYMFNKFMNYINFSRI